MRGYLDQVAWYFPFLRRMKANHGLLHTAFPSHLPPTEMSIIKHHTQMSI